jgi:hypothetical protein
MDDWIPLADCADRFGLAEAVAAAGPAPESDAVSEAAATGAEEASVHYSLDGEEAQDEVSISELQKLIDAGTVSAAAKLWMDGWDDWLTVAQCADRFALRLPSGGGAAAAGPGPTAMGGGNHRPLHLHLDRAAGLAAADFNGKSDPFVVITFNGVKLGSTQVINATLSKNTSNSLLQPCMIYALTYCVVISAPVWDERRQLPALRPDTNRLDLEVYDRDDGAQRGDFLGQVTVDLDDASNVGVVQTSELAPKVKKSDKFNKFVRIQAVHCCNHV